MSTPRFTVVTRVSPTLIQQMTYTKFNDAEAYLRKTRSADVHLYLSFARVSDTPPAENELLLRPDRRPDLASPAALAKMAEIARRHQTVAACHLPLADIDLMRYLEQGGDATGLANALQQAYLWWLIMERRATLTVLLSPDLARYVAAAW